MNITPDENNSCALGEVDIAPHPDEGQQRTLLELEKAASVATRKNWFVGFTIFHFMVAFPKWSIPIFLYCASRAIPLPPNFSEAVRKPVAKLSMFVRQESLAYHECTVEAFQIINKELVLTAEKEYQNVIDRLEHNQMLLDEFGATTKSCSVAGDKAQQAMHHWAVADNQTLHFLNTSSCPNEDQSYIASSLGQGIQQVENEVSSIVEGYVDTSESSFHRVRDYAMERAEYDYNYFLRDRIHPVLELLKQLDVSQVNGVQFSIRPQDIVDELLALLQGFEVAFRTAQIRIQRLQVSLKEFYESINQFLEHYNELYDRMQQTTALLRRMVPSVFTIPDYATMKGIQIGVTFLPPVFAIPEFSYELPSIDLLLNDFSTKALQVIADLLDKLAEEANAVLQAATEAVVQQITELLTLEDYDPPKYKGSRPEISTLEEEASYLSAVGEATEASALFALKKVQDLATWSLRALPTELPDFDTGNSSFAGNTTAFNYQEPKFPDIGIPEWIVFLVNALLSYKIWVDSVVQLIRLFLVKRKYERLAQPEAHEINFYGKEDQGSSGDVVEYLKAVATMTTTVARNLFSYWLIVFLCILPITYLAVALYLPHVNENCLLSDNGTLSVLLVAPLMINQASAQGNAVHLKGEFDCRLRQQLLCDRGFTDSDVLHQKDLVVLSNLQHQYNQQQQWNMRLERCIDTGKLDSQFQHACCGLEGYGIGCLLKPALRDFRCPIDEQVTPPSAFRPLGTYVSDKTCKVNTTTWKLKDARFDCQVLQKRCSSTYCNGVNKDLIHAMVTEADCMVHLYSLRITFFVALLLYHAVMLNIISTFLTNGATALYRHKLIDQDRAFKVQLAADQDGKFTQLEEEIRGRIKKDAETALKSNTLKGRLLLIMGFVFSVFYGVSFWVIEDLASPLK
jgi:hypothetical protein